MTSIPSYWLPRPTLALDAATRAEFERLYAAAVAPGLGQSIDYALAAPKWQFLAYLAEAHPLMLHGSWARLESSQKGAQGNGGKARFPCKDSPTPPSAPAQ
jgi:hypothetical protein